jgi:NAD(P)-dependent dehydrogenase (short-subunit alcohol dehydrogenase family)
MTTTNDLTGKVALVTGASGGLGKHFALTLAKHGMRVGLASRRLAALQEVEREIKALGGIATSIHLDVTAPQSISKAVTDCEQALGPIDVLINNSGINITKPALDQSIADWDAVMNTNLRGVFLMATEVARRMKNAQRAGSIINMASIMGLRQAGHVLPYAVSKAGVIQLTKVLALEWARYKIRVNAIAPGYIETNINRDHFATEAGQAQIKRIPQRHLGQPEDLDGVLLLLASSAGAFMTGSIVTIDGGHVVSGL